MLRAGRNVPELVLVKEHRLPVVLISNLELSAFVAPAQRKGKEHYYFRPLGANQKLRRNLWKQRRLLKRPRG